MENIGDGVNVLETAKSNTAVRTQPSVPNAKPRTKQTKPRTTPEEAAEILRSALSYCLEAGLLVKGWNEGTSLELSIDGLQYADETIIVTPVAAVVTPVTPEQK
jgi:hypothetical protein